MKRFALIPLLALAACGTPQEQCIRQVSGDLPTLDKLIGVSRQNIARGFAYEEITTTRTTWVDCTPRATASHPDPAPRKCLEEVPETTRKPVAIDLNEERAKLASMEERRAQMASALAPAIADCQARYPE